MNKKSRRDPNLLHPSMSVRVQRVGAAHKKACCACGSLPEVRRLVVGIGSGRGGFQLVYCSGCGGEFADRRRLEYVRLQAVLKGSSAEIRLEPDRGDPTWGGWAKERKERKAAKDAAKLAGGINEDV